MVGSDRPVRVVEVELRIDGDQIHVGFPIGVEGADVSPVLYGFLVPVLKLECIDAPLFDHLGDDVFPEVVGTDMLGIGHEVFPDSLGPEQVDAHRDEGVSRIVWKRGRLLWFFIESDNAKVFIHGDDAESGGVLNRDVDCSHHSVRLLGDQPIVHLAVIHLVDMVTGQDQKILRMLGLDEEQILIDGIGGAFVPIFTDTLLWWNGRDVLSQLSVQHVPANSDMSVE